jgi:peptidoglycan/LPS O-acetylase OafA/YrhL
VGVELWYDTVTYIEIVVRIHVSQEAHPRIEALDWLRGLMAVSIMLYHLTIWYIVALDSSSVLGRLGIYGVSVFFVLSA